MTPTQQKRKSQPRGVAPKALCSLAPACVHIPPLHPLPGQVAAAALGFLTRLPPWVVPPCSPILGREALSPPGRAGQVHLSGPGALGMAPVVTDPLCVIPVPGQLPGLRRPGSLTAAPVRTFERARPSLLVLC